MFCTAESSRPQQVAVLGTCRSLKYLFAVLRVCNIRVDGHARLRANPAVKNARKDCGDKIGFFFCCATLKRRREVFDRKLISGPVSKETDKVVNYTPRERRSTYKKFFLLNEKYLVPLIKFRIIRSKPTNNGSQAFELHILNIGIGTFFQSLLTEVLFITPVQRGIFTLNYATISWIGDRTLLEWL